MIEKQLKPYYHLMRLQKPVGTLLLLWPTLAALWAAAEGLPPWTLIIVFIMGTCLMRAAGCVINDFADRDFDGAVARTAQRPLATGELTEKQALICFAILITVAASLLIFLNNFTRLLAIAGVIITMAYPFMKRWTHLPQLVLGVAFSWGIIMAFAAIRETIPSSGWVMFAASFVWITAYDTLYAMVDREDDLKVGIKSTAILFGPADKIIIAMLQLLFLLLLLFLGVTLDYGWAYHIGLGVAATCLTYQQWLILKRQPKMCFKAFSNNVWVGFAIFSGIVLETISFDWLHSF